LIVFQNATFFIKKVNRAPHIFFAEITSISIERSKLKAKHTMAIAIHQSLALTQYPYIDGMKLKIGRIISENFVK